MADVHDDVRELIPELAAGVASGEERARALAHIAGCASCRHELEEVSATVDELLLLAPEREPPPGFDLRVLSGIEGGVRKPTRVRLRLRTSLALAAAAAIVAAAGAAGITWSRGADDRDLADQYRGATANGDFLRAADITWAGTTYGHVFAYAGDPSWLFMTVKAPGSGSYPVRLVTTDGRTIQVGVCTLRDGTGSWGTTVDMPIGQIDRIELVRKGSPTMVAQLA